MDTRRSFYLVSKPNDFAEPVGASRNDLFDIAHVIAANDNLWTKNRLSAAVEIFFAV
jgi:hypothetical protein